ncbi:MAG TPA: PKD domain-containing protein, partial [Thermoplasmata archaeon]|nr:PKD domain-containing protein [Thermoplasmata archaeon]
VAHTYNIAGSYTARAEVSDSLGVTVNSSTTVEVGPAAAGPALSANATVATSFSGSCATTRIQYVFTGSATGGASPYSYYWTFGDGGVAYGPSVRHAYSGGAVAPATATPTLTVTDATGASARATVDLPPVVIHGPSCPPSTTGAWGPPTGNLLLVGAAALVGLAVTAVVVVRLRRRA